MTECHSYYFYSVCTHLFSSINGYLCDVVDNRLYSIFQKIIAVIFGRQKYTFQHAGIGYSMKLVHSYIVIGPSL